MYRNPLPVTPEMRRYRVDMKVNVVMMMPAADFLNLTLPRKTARMNLIERIYQTTGYYPATLEEYKRWALHPSEDYGPMAPVMLTIEPTENPAIWQVVTHEGRHRVGAMLKAGEKQVEVSLIIGRSRCNSILDLPPIIEGEKFFGAESHHLFLTKNISEILETNIQEQYQRPNSPYCPLLIENRLMGQTELRQLLKTRIPETLSEKKNGKSPTE